MHGFIVVCDITNLQSIRDVPDWLAQIEHKADVTLGRQIAVFVNKIETLLSNNGSDTESSVMGYAESDFSPTGTDIQEKALDRLSTILQRDYPGVPLYEISVKQNLDVTESFSFFSEELHKQRSGFIRQRYLNNWTRLGMNAQQ